MNTVLEITATVFASYAWIRFCDWKLGPWLLRKRGGNEYTLRALRRMQIDIASTPAVSVQDLLKANAAIDSCIAEVMGRLRSAGK